MKRTNHGIAACFEPARPTDYSPPAHRRLFEALPPPTEKVSRRYDEGYMDAPGRSAFASLPVSTDLEPQRAIATAVRRLRGNMTQEELA